MNDRSLPAFRLGDVRGLYPDEIDEDFATAFAYAFARRFASAGTIATGRDMRDCSEPIQIALNEAFARCGIDVIDMGLCATELGYFASTLPDIGAAIVVTASHNPPRYNGFKCVLRNGEAVTFDTGLSDVMALMLAGERPGNDILPGKIFSRDLRSRYLEYMQPRFDVDKLRDNVVALNGLNGTAATLAGTIAEEFQIPVTWFRKEPGPIPDEGADPSSPRLQAEMRSFMQADKFRLGVAWDGDCDRCVVFDGDGKLVPTYYLIGMLAAYFLERHPGRAIVFDTKLCWNTLDIVERHGGIAIPSKTGHAFVKRKMREHDAIYGGELSSHHFYADFFHCDSGMFTWLRILEIVNTLGIEIDALVEDRRRQICCTPEINLEVDDPGAAFETMVRTWAPRASRVDDFDGPSIELPEGWRFTLRHSKTEPLIRLNFESRMGPEVLLEQGQHILEELRPWLRNPDAPLPRLSIQ